MDYEFLRDQLTNRVPFPRHVGVEVKDIADGAATALFSQTEQISNHVGSIHAGALFTLGETASGAAMLGAFAPMAAQMRPLAISATIKYLKLGRGTVQARAKTSVAGAELRHALVETGTSTFNVDVDLEDDRGRIVSQMIVAWRVTMPTSQIP